MAHVGIPIGRAVASVPQSRMMSVMTVGRLLLVPIMISTFMVKPAITTLVLLVFMFADLADGVVARHLGADDRFRRAADSIVDRVAIDSCLVAACVNGVLPWPVLAGVLARDLWCGAVCAHLLRARGVVIKGDLPYKALAASFGVWALLAPFVAATFRNDMAGAILAFAVVVAIDFTRAAYFVLRGRIGVRDTSLEVADVRRGPIYGPHAPSGLWSRRRGARQDI